MKIGMLEGIIEEDSFLFWENLSDVFLNRHHVIPLAVRNEMKLREKKGNGKKRSKKNKELSEKIRKLFERFDMIDINLTKRVPIKWHDNYNLLFRGDFLPTEVLGKLRYEILRTDYKMCGRSKKTIVRFFFYAAKFNNVEYNNEEIKAIDRKLEKGCIFPVNLLVMFKITREDIEYYLEENFLYPGYYRFYEVWDFLSENGHKRNRRGANGYHKMFIDNRI
ncbi:MAG: hypothetical protein U9N04_01825 [Patescibacteria group bacterium]|nr:hypothetical protein [Patescibacteria group bacterium]